MELSGFKESSTTTEKQQRQTFAIVSAVHNVGRYLDDFIASIEQQDFDLEQLQIIMVDDGSTDDSLEHLTQWHQRRPSLVTVIHKDQGGQSSARNVGLEVARAEWVTFLDPDDYIDQHYFSTVERLISEYPDATMVATKRIYYFDESGTIRDSHPSRRMFSDGNILVDLRMNPGYFHGHGPSAFVRLSVVHDLELRFDEMVRPNFEDSLFLCEYLLRVDPIVVFAATAHYYYRRRADGSSTLQQATMDAKRFTVVPRLAYLHILQEATRIHGTPPEWLQNLILYELSFYFAREQKAVESRTAAVGDVADEFMGLLNAILSYIDNEIIAAYQTTQVPPSTRDFWLHGFNNHDWHTPYALVDKYDQWHGLIRVRYRYIGKEPQHEYISGGISVEPVYSKIHTFDFFDRTLICERIAWLHADSTLRVRLREDFVEIRSQDQDPPHTSINLKDMTQLLAIGTRSFPFKQPLMPSLVPGSRGISIHHGFLPLLEAKLSKRKYANAWVLMDSRHSGGSNANILFEYLRTRRPDINAYFTVDANTSTYQRLKAGPHHSRVVAYGSDRWIRIMLHCTHVLSSECNTEQMNPSAIRRLRAPDWRFVFLPHDVITDDQSRLLNPKSIDLFVTSTIQEYESITENGPYIFTRKEVKLTGLPKFDRLWQLSHNISKEQRNVLLIAPACRNSVKTQNTYGQHHRRLVPDWSESEVCRSWIKLLTAPELVGMVHTHGLRVVLLSQAKLRDVTSRAQLPSEIEVLDIESEDVHSLITHAALFLTDYSSMAFDAAFIERPCVYFQFDDVRLHIDDQTANRDCCFDYRRDGFGPVTISVEETLEAIRTTLESESKPDKVYRSRIESIFGFRDDMACKRIIAAIEYYSSIRS